MTITTALKKIKYKRATNLMEDSGFMDPHQHVVHTHVQPQQDEEPRGHHTLHKEIGLYDANHCIDPVWPGDTMWHHRSELTLVHIMACCLMAPSHYQNRCWLIISKANWHSSQGNFTIDTLAINPFKSPKSKGVECHNEHHEAWKKSPIQQMTYPNAFPEWFFFKFLLHFHW